MGVREGGCAGGVERQSEEGVRGGVGRAGW